MKEDFTWLVSTITSLATLYLLLEKKIPVVQLKIPYMLRVVHRWATRKRKDSEGPGLVEGFTLYLVGTVFSSYKECSNCGELLSEKEYAKGDYDRSCPLCGIDPVRFRL